ncbi:hypothetical protein [Streptomyces sp. NBC_00481]|uniref:hypothetical protein n=1 Tax=unclassified Streptomyces TaxID=2593676 RepID=UPI003FA3CDBE
MGGGFGPKQETLVENIVALAVLLPVKCEYTRAEQFCGATTRPRPRSTEGRRPPRRHPHRSATESGLPYRRVRQPRRTIDVACASTFPGANSRPTKPTCAISRIRPSRRNDYTPKITWKFHPLPRGTCPGGPFPRCRQRSSRPLSLLHETCTSAGLG